jgi:hypothetical protein
MLPQIISLTILKCYKYTICFTPINAGSNNNRPLEGAHFGWNALGWDGQYIIIRKKQTWKLADTILACMMENTHQIFNISLLLSYKGIPFKLWCPWPLGSKCSSSIYTILSYKLRRENGAWHFINHDILLQIIDICNPFGIHKSMQTIFKHITFLHNMFKLAFKYIWTNHLSKN